jgi:hypothetical protein
VPTLDAEQLRGFARDGYLLVPGVVSDALMESADAEITELVSTDPPADGPDGSAPGRHGWFPPVARLPRCDEMLRQSGALAIAEELVAPHTLDHRFDHIQVATTVPPYPHIPGGPHLDNHGQDDNPPESFTLLAGVLLTDQDVPQAGNLWLWPGSHLDHSRLFHERGTRILKQSGGHVTLLEPPFPIGEAVELQGRRGDLLLAHFLTGHNGGGNTGGGVRRTVYYRLATPRHPERWETTFLDPFTEYRPVRRAAATKES